MPFEEYFANQIRTDRFLTVTGGDIDRLINDSQNYELVLEYYERKERVTVPDILNIYETRLLAEKEGQTNVVERAENIEEEIFEDLEVDPGGSEDEIYLEELRQRFETWNERMMSEGGQKLILYQARENIRLSE